jgi:predicted AlkP superfamily phosphohydrolase/phosphomutase
MAPKFVIIGIDGGTFDVIGSMLEQNQLPALSKIMRHGVYGNLQSVVPPITATAWSSFLTGVTPGKHGVFHFFRQNDDGKFVLCNYNSIRRETLYSILSRNKLNISSLGVPMTYPPPTLNGHIVSGFPVPDNAENITFPKYLKSELEERVGYYETDIDYGEFGLSAEKDEWEKYDNLLARLYWLTEKQHKCNLHLLKNKSCDIFFTVYSLTDRIQHFFWKFFDERHPDFTEEGKRRFGEAVYDSYRKTDEMIGELLENVDDDTSIIVLSDHGFGRYIGDLNVGNVLIENGLMALKKRNVVHDVPVSVGRIFEKLKLPFLKKVLPKSIAERTVYHGKFVQSVSTHDIDWERTKVYPFMWGARVNLKGREPHGIVAPEAKDDLLKQVEEILRGIRDPRFPDSRHYIQVKTRDKIRSGDYVEEAEDLYLAFFTDKGIYHPRSGIHSPGFFNYGGKEGRSGTHKFNGMFILKDKNVKQNLRISNLKIIDIAPTLLYLLGLNIPQMDGKIIFDAIKEEYIEAHKPFFEESQSVNMDETPEQTEEEIEMMNSLRALGYID